MTRVPLVEVDDDALVWRRILVESHDVVFVRGIFEASEGVACMFAERGGDLLLVAPREREQELDEIVEDLRAELGAIVTSKGVNGGSKQDPSA